jgi:hypothetical protein
VQGARCKKKKTQEARHRGKDKKQKLRNEVTKSLKAGEKDKSKKIIEKYIWLKEKLPGNRAAFFIVLYFIPSCKGT